MSLTKEKNLCVSVQSAMEEDSLVSEFSAY